jgi:hypothetical protein
MLKPTAVLYRSGYDKTFAGLILIIPLHLSDSTPHSRLLPLTFLLLRLNGRDLSAGFQLKFVVGDLVNQLHMGVMGQPVVA